MAGQAAMLSRKEAAAKQKAVELKSATPGTNGSGAEPECKSATPGTKKNPSSAKG